MNQAVLQLLRCPVCHAELASDDGRVCRCKGKDKQHCFDFSRSGYLNLGGSHAGDGDAKDAVLARRAFLDAGYYSCLSEHINLILDSLSAQTVLDAGSGEGYYTNRMAEKRDVLGIDLSRNGVDYAARRAKQTGTRAGFAVASLFALPVKDACLDAVVSLFAPCAEQEFLRVLKPGGHLLLVGAGERHLMGLKQALYDDPYRNTGRADLPTVMEHISCQHLQDVITVEGNEMIQALFSMTPYYWRTSPKDRQKLQGLSSLTTEIDFDIFLFRKGL